MSWGKHRKSKTFSVPVEREIRKINKNGNEDTITIPFKTKFIHTVKFMAISLSNLVDNPAEGIH